MWDEITKIKVKMVTSRHLETIDDAIDIFHRLDLALKGLDDADGGNPVRAFNSLYLAVTQDVETGISQGAYLDSHFMKVLDVEFARLYFEALHKWTEGKIVPISWALLFQLEHDGQRHTDFEGAVLGVNAHVNRDLTYALVAANAKVGSPGKLSDRRRDYDHINGIFRERLDPVSNQLIDSLRNKPWRLLWLIIDEVMQEVDEWLLHRAIVACRDRAWKRATHAWSIDISNGASKCSGRNQLSGFLAHLVLNSHVFDKGFFSSSGAHETVPVLVRSPEQLRLDDAIPNASELLFGSDLLEVKIDGNRAEVVPRRSGIEGRWEGERDSFGSLFEDQWLVETIDAESDSDIEILQMKLDVEFIRTQKAVFIPASMR